MVAFPPIPVKTVSVRATHVDWANRRFYVPGKPAQMAVLHVMIGASIKMKIIGQQLSKFPRRLP
jgi:hypothetical protein